MRSVPITPIALLAALFLGFSVPTGMWMVSVLEGAAVAIFLHLWWDKFKGANQ